MLTSKIEIAALQAGYPRLMKSKVTTGIVLMLSSCSGIVVVPDGKYPIGHYYPEWTGTLETFTGTISITQD